jgi:hypothetical protein
MSGGDRPNDRLAEADRDVLLGVVAAVAEVEGVEIHELGYALHDHVYTGAIRGLLEGGYDDWELTFRVPGHEVTVRAGGAVYVDGDLVRELDVDESAG